MRRTMAKASLHTAANLLFFTLIGTAMLAVTFELTRETIKESEEKEKMKLIAQIVPEADYDNDILKDIKPVAADEMLGSDEETIVYRGRLNDEPTVAVLEAIAPDGYGGKVKLIVAFHQDGKIGGVRVITHNETPGLGDYIDIAKDGWITVFKDKSLETSRNRDWKVRKDGGTFDYMAGATISPRAIIKAVHKAAQYFALHKNELFEPVVLAPHDAQRPTVVQDAPVAQDKPAENNKASGKEKTK